MSSRVLIAQGPESAELDSQFLALRRGPTVLEAYPSYSSCACEDCEPRQRTLSNGVVQIVMQCLACGKQVRHVKKDETDLRREAHGNPPFDPAIAEAFYAQRQAKYDAWRQ